MIMREKKFQLQTSDTIMFIYTDWHHRKPLHLFYTDAAFGLLFVVHHLDPFK